MNFQYKAQKGFIKLSNVNKKKYQIVDSNLDIKKNETLIIKQIDRLVK